MVKQGTLFSATTARKELLETLEKKLGLYIVETIREYEHEGDSEVTSYILNDGRTIDIEDGRYYFISKELELFEIPSD